MIERSKRIHVDDAVEDVRCDGGFAKRRGIYTVVTFERVSIFDAF